MPGVVDISEFSRISVRELHPTFAAEVSGIDWTNVDDETLEEIKAAVHKYGVCVFRNTGLDDTAHVEFSRRLGDLDDVKRYLQGGRKLRYEYYELFDAGNLDEENNLLDPDSPRAHANRGNELFHSDSTFNPRRSSYSLLRAVTLPPPGTGGETEFADSRTAYADLPAPLRSELEREDYVGAHTFAQSRKLGSPAFFADLDPSSFEMARHRLVQIHAGSGRRTLCAGAHLHHIEGRGACEERRAEGLPERLRREGGAAAA
ncbi:uncharacterized protein DNG_10189 [Cephalotrichum gorgonifer]|uniref:TauD/TfdA-like domain-containing protein n=1 Tax=Cephalotrichum gorgonifer TaxID=2041049 RepID=A0AAE8N9B1_9PEZI|nr:uncharacterized protein DNG_10189 [Cephalotrichum gorgonifer]